MFKVECPGCKASYNVDERRVPAGTGMKMRCPKCTNTFQVKRPEEAGADLPAAKPAAPPPAAKPATTAAPPLKTRKATVIGLGDMMPGLPGGPTPSGEEDLLPAVVPKNRPAPAAAPVGNGFDDIDLPAVAADLPAPGAPKGVRSRTSMPLDLDAPGGNFPDLELDLPAPAADLPAVRGNASAGAAAPKRDMGYGAGDLPIVKGKGAAQPAGIDLPTVKGADLPSVKGASVVKSDRQITGGVLFDDIDLPMVGADLPVVSAALPAPREVELPAKKPAAMSGGFGDIDLPLTTPAKPGASLDAGFGDDFDFDAGAPPPRPAPKAPPQAGPEIKGIGTPRAPSLHDMQPVQMPGASPFDDDPFAKPLPMTSSAPKAAPPAPPPAPAPAAAAAAAAASSLTRQAGGSTNFGEVDLGGDDDFGAPPPAQTSAPAASASAPGWGERDLGGGDDDMEFEAIPQEKAGPKDEGASSGSVAEPAPGSVPLPTAGSEPRPRRAPEAPALPKQSGRHIRTIALVGTLVLFGGGALTFTPLGPFGYNAIYDLAHQKDYETLRTTTQGTIREAFAKDTASAATQALAQAEAAHQREPRAGSVAALAAYATYLKEIRFGHDSAQHAHANTLLGTIPPDASPQGFELAKAAQAAASDQLARGQNQIEAVVRRTPADLDALALAAEIALSAKDAERANAHWQKLVTDAPSPRSHFGMARALLLKKDTLNARDAAQKALAQEPKHAGALLLLAQIAWDSQQDEATANRHLDQLKKAEPEMASKDERVAMLTLGGQIHLSRSRVSAAEAAFGEALKINPKGSGALNGMGEALYRAGRFAEALARYGSAMEADPEAIEPKLGVAKTKLALERLQEAKDLMRGLDKKLRDEGKPSFRVTYWKGRVNEALGDKAAAENDYNEAIKIAGESHDVVDTYVALAQLLYTVGRPIEAQNKLDEAKNKLPRSVTLFKALGDLASQSGRYAEAEAQYQNALQMDPQDISTRFRLGTTLRRLAKFDAASEAFDKVNEADKDYPGLALERAVLFEASGQSAKAVELYEAALAKAPNDPDLKQRVAAALLAANQPGQRAEELLRSVLQQRQNSAEANHYFGRALLAKGTNLAEALRYLRRAADLDPNRAEFYLYIGWAANEADDQQLAASSLAKALELDKSLADAYWQRGVLRRRQRALADAEGDLQKALELRPSRYEAHATLAEVYQDEQKWPAAQAAWQKAISADAKRAYWHFSYGKLIYQHGSKGAALGPLTDAVKLASQAQTPPAWMADACLLLGDVERTAGKKELAKEHLQRFLSLAPVDSPYRVDAEKSLKALGP